MGQSAGSVGGFGTKQGGVSGELGNAQVTRRFLSGVSSGRGGREGKSESEQIRS